MLSNNIDEVACRNSFPAINKTICFLSTINPTIDGITIVKRVLYISSDKILKSSVLSLPISADNLGIDTIKIEDKMVLTIVYIFTETEYIPT